MIHPEYQLLDKDDQCPVEETLTPVYPSTQGLTQSRLRQLVKQTLTLCMPHLTELEWMNSEQLQKHQFPTISQAIYFLHNPSPDTPVTALENGEHPALRRLVFEELLAHNLSMQLARKSRSVYPLPF